MTPRDAGAVPLRLLARAIAAAALAEIALRTVPLPALAGVLGVRLGRSRGAARESGFTPSPRELARARRATRVVYRRFPGGGTCLREALVTGHLLRRFDPVLRIGAARDTDGIHAHAWLEVGSSVLGHDDERFSPLGRAC